MLEALLTERNVTRAAERMSLGQPAMSAALARLRKQLADPLLIREGRTYRLSALAESLIEPVRELVEAADELLGARKPFDPARLRRTFTVMTSDYVTLVLLKPLLGTLARQAPGVQLNVVPFDEDFESRLRRSGVDLLICPMQFTEVLGGLPYTVLFEDRYVLAGDRDNPLFAGEITAESFRDLRYVGNPVLLAAQLEALGVARTSELNVYAHVIVPFILSGTPLVSFVQERLARAVREVAHLAIRPSPVPLETLREALFWTHSSKTDPAHEWLRARLIQQAAELGPPPS
jgi:DNA-binding transcriptional LysR family regulator